MLLICSHRLIWVPVLLTATFFIISACDHKQNKNGENGGICEPSQTIPPGEVSLDGTWSAWVRTRTTGGSWSEETSVGDVQVPGWLFPFEQFPEKDQEVQLRYSRPITWPEDWVCAKEEDGYRLILELDSADYYSVIQYAGETVGRHNGYVGRFGIQLPNQNGEHLDIILTDAVHDMETDQGMEKYPRSTIQGADTGGWGLNPVGLPGSVRVRLVRGLYIRNLYAAVLTQRENETTIRVGLDTESYTTATSTSAGVRIIDNEDVPVLERVVTPEFDAKGEGYFEMEVQGLDKAGLDEPKMYTVEVSLIRDGVLADVRTAPFMNRRVGLSEDSLTINGENHFARGAAVNTAYRFLPFSEPFEPGKYVNIGEELKQRYQEALDNARSTGVQWLRPAHLVPDGLFLELVRKEGFLVYQDFPLHWNTDYEILTPDEIKRQFREFIWRVASEPAVAMISVHNEAEVLEKRSDTLSTTQDLITDLLSIAAEVAPHLPAVGCSGCKGTAVFPSDDSYPVADSISDAHGYFGSWWQPFDGFNSIPQKVEQLTEDPLPVFWSEMGNGWTLHYVYLSELTDELEPMEPPQMVALRSSLESWLRAPNGDPLNLRQFYVATFCLKNLVVPLDELESCVMEKITELSDSEIIAWARHYFMADRSVVEGSPADPVENAVLVAAHWLAAQIYESRWLWTQDMGFLGVLSWYRGEHGYPFVLSSFDSNHWLNFIPESAVLRSQEIIASANAPVASSLRNIDEGVEARLINDGGEKSFTLSLYSGEIELWSEDSVLAAGSGVSILIPASTLTGREGEILRLNVSQGGATHSEAKLVYSLFPNR